jgi:hypothetical protein
MSDRNTKIRGSQIFNGGVKFEDMNESAKTGLVAYAIDGGDLEIQVGVAGELYIPFPCEIQEVTLLADQVGSIVLDILKDSYANYPSATSITASEKPTISSSDKSQDGTITGWTTTINEGDYLRFNVESVTNITRCTVHLKILRI